ncbi:histidine phosphatase family protein [Streptomyces sp. NBC_00160]|uniref:histidine phosphatase family protein n=1 Tax=Streptomyces sp. NBC_00160 TaxID=2903628 RepID=UPI00224DF18B|nr:histidine phosphatase family protein [Streptomyces sp. NBC_00160]MCX5302783.1 histidine phosphatase family protein [Streptomyces sp. NBC_00160]
MTSRVMLISPAVSAALREARFDDGCSLDAAGLRRARSAAGTQPAAGQVFASPSVRRRKPAAGAGLDAVPLPEMAGWEWAGGGAAPGRVTAAEPDAVAAWLADPGCAPHGGESLLELCDRVGGGLDAVAGEAGRVIVVVEPDAVCGAAGRALGVTAQAFWRIDVPPLTAVKFSGRAGRWSLRAGRPRGDAE